MIAAFKSYDIRKQYLRKGETDVSVTVGSYELRVAKIPLIEKVYVIDLYPCFRGKYVSIDQ